MCAASPVVRIVEVGLVGHFLILLAPCPFVDNRTDKPQAIGV
jgi:hypothetical protein